MFRKVKVELVSLTPEVAERFALLTPLPGERALKSSRMTYLETQLLNGDFYGPDWAQGVCLENGQTYRLDGQHSSMTLHKLPKGATFPAITATIASYEFDSMLDVVDLFNLFNNPRSVRGNDDMMGVWRAHVAELSDYSRPFLVCVSNGLHEYEKMRKKKAKAKDAVLFDARERGMYFTHPTRPDFLVFTHWLATFREAMNAHFLKKPVLISEMVADYVVNATLADEFWHLVFTESHQDPEHETRELAAFFREEFRHAKDPKIDMALLRKRSAKAWKQFTKGSVPAAATAA